MVKRKAFCCVMRGMTHALLVAMKTTTMNFVGAMADMSAAIKGADAETLGSAWDRVQAGLAKLPILSRCNGEQTTERERLLGERAALLEADRFLSNR